MSKQRAAGKTAKKVSASKTFSMKDRLFNETTVGMLAGNLRKAHRGFRAPQFQRDVLARLADLELKACIEFMADTLKDYLPSRYPDACRVLTAALPPKLDPTRSDDDFGEFIWAVPSEFAARHGCNKTHLETSLALLHETTQRFSAEFAIRPFLASFPDPTYAFLQRCAVDDNYHVRRLASEGIRPRLPWGQRIDLSNEHVIAMLDELHSDSTRFVTRSVANSLNDISKSDPDRVLATLRKWSRLGAQDAQELEWITRHALRGLIKDDHPEALQLLGYPTDPAFSLSAIRCSTQVQIGEALEWSARLKSGGVQKLKVLLRVHFLKANGTHAPKVYALKELSMVKGEQAELSKRIPIRAMTTRALYPGEHFLELVVNGVTRGRKRFELLD